MLPTDQDHEESARLFAHIDVVIKSRYCERLGQILGQISVLVVFYLTRWTKLDHTCICFKEFLNELNLLYKYRMNIYACLMIQKNLQENSKSLVVIFSKYEYYMLAQLTKNNLYDLQIIAF
jgi:hypothetical protein